MKDEGDSLRAQGLANLSNCIWGLKLGDFHAEFSPLIWTYPGLYRTRLGIFPPLATKEPGCGSGMVP